MLESKIINHWTEKFLVHCMVSKSCPKCDIMSVLWIFFQSNFCSPTFILSVCSFLIVCFLRLFECLVLLLQSFPLSLLFSLLLCLTELLPISEVRWKRKLMLRHKHIIYYTLKIVNSYIKLIKNKITFHKSESKLAWMFWIFPKRFPYRELNPGLLGESQLS